MRKKTGIFSIRINPKYNEKIHDRFMKTLCEQNMFCRAITMKINQYLACIVREKTGIFLITVNLKYNEKIHDRFMKTLCEKK